MLGDFTEQEKISNLDSGIDLQLQCIGSLLHAMESSLADNMYDILPDDFSNLKLCIIWNIYIYTRRKIINPSSFFPYNPEMFNA